MYKSFRRFLLNHAAGLLVFVYHLRKHLPSVIGEIFYEAYLMEQVTFSLSRSARHFSRSTRLPDGYGKRLSERIVELPWVLTHLPKGAYHLDAGSSLNFEPLLSAKQLRTKKLYIINLNPERYAYWDRGISYVFDDLRAPVFADHMFDSISCISTLEHVGMDNTSYLSKAAYRERKRNDHLRAIREFSRILRKKGVCLITIPYGTYADHGWIQVFNDRMIRRIVTTFKPSRYTITYYRYTQNGWQLSTADECRKETYSDGYRGPDYCVGARAVACLELVK